jgi:hypothetical protein
LDSVEDLKNLVHSELQDVFAGVRPPESAEYARHLPDPLVVDFLVQNVLLPILTGIVGGILTYWVTSRDDKKNVEEIKSQLAELHASLERIEKKEHFDANVEADFDKAANTILRLRGQIRGPIQFEVSRQLTEIKVAEALERFHVGPKTAELKAERVVTRVLEVLKIAQ